MLYTHCVTDLCRDKATLTALQQDASDHTSSSQACSALAKALRPRYHISSTLGKNFFYQRLPYENDNSTCSSIHLRATWHTRFISLATITNSKDKNAKWIHALSLEAAAIASEVSLGADPAQMYTPCPYMSTPPMKSGCPPPPPPPGHPPPKRARIDGTDACPPPPPPAPPSGAFFFGDMGVPRGGGGNDSHRGGGNLQQQPPSADARTLFIGGLGSNVRDRDFHTVFSGIVAIRQPPGKNFAFVEFDSPSSAQAVMTASQSTMGVSIKGRPVSVGWAAGSANGSGGGGGRGIPGAAVLQTAPLSADCKTLFIAGLPPYVEVGHGSGDKGMSTNQTQVEETLQHTILGLFPGAIRLQRLPGKTFGFLDFDTHAAACAGMNAYAKSPELYRISSGDGGSGGGMLSVGWSKSGGDNKKPEGDASSSCWFCLASPTAKVRWSVTCGVCLL